ncbi:hypothetical protein GCM10018785_72800 [Streptomyces longispororuber]|uniref:Uncharacterized protein n=1 Tax=Streptomyces longispororuber TaxID=68230 RepID=A0A919AC02_9ACTN|nr:hypothetical protein GCM10018785_72800 [Streptomyces longispororuber]
MSGAVAYVAGNGAVAYVGGVSCAVAYLGGVSCAVAYVGGARPGAYAVVCAARAQARLRWARPRLAGRRGLRAGRVSGSSSRTHEGTPVRSRAGRPWAPGPVRAR